jgi:hypothetical protein
VYLLFLVCILAVCFASLQEQLLRYFNDVKSLVSDCGSCSYNESVNILSVWDSNDYYITPWTAGNKSSLTRCFIN